MNADEYNAAEWRAGRLRIAMVTEMTKIAQRQLGLPVDGKCGERTRAAVYAGFPISNFVSTLVAKYPGTSPLAAAAVETAVSLRGRGEEGANNSGPFITELGGDDGDLWCALFVGHCWRKAYEREGKPSPAWTCRRPGVAEPGAKALVGAASSAQGGRIIAEPENVLPGDLALWKRDGGHHVALVWHPAPGGVVVTVEGNVGAFPARVRELTHDVHNEPHFVCFARPPYL